MRNHTQKIVQTLAPFNVLQSLANELFHMLLSGAAWCIWGPKEKIDYHVLYAKLLLININYVEFFLFLEIL